MKEASARIKINKLLEAAGWRFFADEKGPANIQLEPSVTLKAADIDALGQNFEKAKKGFIDFLLLNEKGFPFIVLEAKSEDKNPLVGKEQARSYARSQKCRFVILSNGNLHYFWDLEQGNPQVITSFPSPESVAGYQKIIPMPASLAAEMVAEDFVVLTQRPSYLSEAGWKNEAERERYKETHGLRFLRRYQIQAIHAIQKAVGENKTRFLLEMATGTGKTLTSAALIKLFLRTRNAQRVLFLVDRLELEDQAWKAFTKLLAKDYKTVIYKDNRDDWRHAEIVVSTVQSLLFDNKFQRLFSPTDFDLVISDEAHRSIGGNARAVFDYFIGYKLGLTATPKDYLKNLDKDEAHQKDPREYERRLMLDTYRTFGCEDGQPTFRYSLLDGVKDGFLINPTVVDCRTEITTQLLSDTGFVVDAKEEDDGEDDDKEVYRIRQFEKRFFSPATNQLFCKTFLENGLRDPVSAEFGKSIVFAVSQHHAAKLTQILNEMADVIWPGRYQSDFAVQVTSHVTEAQQYTINFTNNNLMGSGHVLPEYRTSKTRVCVTVGMMTTGYDCPDILNLGLFRPIFSPTDFIQIKGRGTRKHDFREQLRDEDMKSEVKQPQKTSFKLFDFFANCEYFEEEFDYDEVIKTPRPSGGTGGEEGGTGGGPTPSGGYEHLGEDIVSTLKEDTIGPEGMKVDRMFFKQFEDTVKADPVVTADVQAGRWEHVIDYIHEHLLDKPTEHYTLEKLRKAAGVDRRLSLREVLEKVFGLIPGFKSKDELLEEEFAKFLADVKPGGEEAEAIPALKTFFKAYATSERIRHIIEAKEFGDLAANPVFSIADFKAVPKKFRELVPQYIRDYVPVNQFVA
ncbi:MAG: DEAD/DEAH box helicase family protein [Verrucomicrobiaceae bacterium]|nr:DEAD/DEAH box helicase family protein [Verrucomicrobiaceae bacterium]